VTLTTSKRIKFPKTQRLAAHEPSPSAAVSHGAPDATVPARPAPEVPRPEPAHEAEVRDLGATLLLGGATPEPAPLEPEGMTSFTTPLGPDPIHMPAPQPEPAPAPVFGQSPSSPDIESPPMDAPPRSLERKATPPDLPLPEPKVHEEPSPEPVRIADAAEGAPSAEHRRPSGAEATPVAADRQAGTKPVRRGATRAERDAGRERRDAATSRKASSKAPGSQKRTSEVRRLSIAPLHFGKVGLAVVVIASAAASFLAVSATRDWLAGSGAKAPATTVVHEPTPASEVPSAREVDAMKSQLSLKAAPQPSASSAAPSAEQQTSVSEEAIPAGMALGAGKGVLKVVTSGAHAIYVDGEFAGRGPVRIVPLEPGKHEVKTRLEGEEHTYSAEVKAGRLTRFAVAGD
jgi:hypothetical protein